LQGEGEEDGDGNHQLDGLGQPKIYKIVELIK